MTKAKQQATNPARLKWLQAKSLARRAISAAAQEFERSRARGKEIWNENYSILQSIHAEISDEISKLRQRGEMMKSLRQQD